MAVRKSNITTETALKDFFGHDSAADMREQIYGLLQECARFHCKFDLLLDNVNVDNAGLNGAISAFSKEFGQICDKLETIAESYDPSLNRKSLN
jgi:hypothetical protein